MSNGSVLDFNFNLSSGVSDQIASTAPVTLGSGTGSETLNINLNGVLSGSQTFTLITGNSLTDNIADTTTAWNVPSSSTYNYTISHTGTALDLTIASKVVNLTWTGGPTATWVLGGALNWSNSVSPSISATGPS